MTISLPAAAMVAGLDWAVATVEPFGSRMEAWTVQVAEASVVLVISDEMVSDAGPLMPDLKLDWT